MKRKADALSEEKSLSLQYEGTISSIKFGERRLAPLSLSFSLSSLSSGEIKVNKSCMSSGKEEKGKRFLLVPATGNA